jgi:polyisoprenoid-binding protein YceI
MRAVACRIAVAAFAPFAACAVVGAAEWTTVPENSAVTMYATKQGAWFSGVFEEFTATIDFDAANPEAARIIGVVKTGSVNTRDKLNDAYVLGYLNVEKFPEAIFESKTVERTAEGYRASGELTLTGYTNPATLAFTFVPGEESSILSTHARFTGAMVINRFDYGIASDVDPSQTGQDVTIQVELDLKR